MTLLLLVMMGVVMVRADVPVCTHDTMEDHAFCFPPEYNKVNMNYQGQEMNER